MSHLFKSYSNTFLAIPEHLRARNLFELTAKLPLRMIRANPERPYLERYFLSCSETEYVYLHRFVNGDGDRYTHNHPWAEAHSLILTGHYEEIRREAQDAPETLRLLRPGDQNLITNENLHRISYTAPETWTLFSHSEWISDWGFLDDTGAMQRNQSDPDGSNRFWWWKPAAKSLHSQRSPMADIGIEELAIKAILV